MIQFYFSDLTSTPSPYLIFLLMWINIRSFITLILFSNVCNFDEFRIIMKEVYHIDHISGFRNNGPSDYRTFSFEPAGLFLTYEPTE